MAKNTTFQGPKIIYLSIYLSSYLNYLIFLSYLSILYILSIYLIYPRYPIYFIYPRYPFYLSIYPFYLQERELLSTQLEEFQGEKSALNSLLDQLKAEIKDSADNYKIKERKNIQLAKDLKKQLINEQKRCAKLQERLQQVSRSGG